MPAEVTIRPLAQEDIESVASLLEALATQYILHEFESSAKDQFLSRNNAQSIAKLVAQGFRYHVAELNGHIVGFVGVRDNRHLYHLFVANGYQRQGLGRRLWNIARAACLEAGSQGGFTVNSSNNAVPIYQRLGFVRAGPARNMEGVLYNPMSTDDAV
ncbi:MAG TPA: GNAT family N-acetyltransferase [Burkholderiales bacterium]|nr:GNAT family N-acetyltransferase [Burkholderiales bacterium]